MRSYRVWEHGSPDAMRLDLLSDLVPGPEELVVDVKAAGVGFVDALMVSGRYQIRPPLPFTPGMEFAGTVRSIGRDVTGFAPGDRVAACVLNGAFAEQAVATPRQLFPLPEEVPFTDAALLCLPYLTAHLALFERARLEPGESVLVGGAGGAVGLAAVQIAKARGATVLGTVRSAVDGDAVRSAGADTVIDLSAAEGRDALRAQVHAATGGKGADVVVDPIGGTFLGDALRATAWRGRAVVVGFAGGGIPEVKANYLLLKNIAVLGLELNGYRDRLPELLRHAQGEIFELWRRGVAKPRVTRRFELNAIPEALAFVAGGHTAGRALVVVDG